jgi:hypothetical protein
MTNNTFTPGSRVSSGVELVDGKLLRLRLQQAVRGEMGVARQAELLVCAAASSCGMLM